jgi:hypothetical protein
MENYTVVQLKKMIKDYKKTNCPAISRMRKSELLEIIKTLKIDTNTKTEKDKMEKVKIEKVKIEKHPPLKQIDDLFNKNIKLWNVPDKQKRWMAIREIVKNQPAFQINETIKELEKRLERGDYEDDEKGIKKAKKDIIYLKNLVLSDKIYEVFDDLPLYEWNRKGKFNSYTNRME